MVEPYAVYGHFYDATQSRPDAATYRHLLQRHHPNASTLLELACGTGAHLALLAKDYAAEGLDVSRTMLRYARKRLPGVRLHHRSMVGFRLKRRFDAVICPYDSMNHLLSFREWTRTFRAAKRHLNQGGVFIFDVNTEHRLRELAATPPWVRYFNGNCLIMAVGVRPTGIAEWDIKVFERRRYPRYDLHHEVIRERAFAHDHIKRALGRIFRDVRAYDGAGLSRPKAKSRRLFYVCR